MKHVDNFLSIALGGIAGIISSDALHIIYSAALGATVGWLTKEGWIWVVARIKKWYNKKKAKKEKCEKPIL